MASQTTPNQGLTWSLLRNDLRRNSAINLVLFAFLFSSAILMASGVAVIERLSGSLDEIFAVAQPPHFLQMHIGPVDHAAVNEFANGAGLVESSQVQPMATVSGTDIHFTRADGSSGSFSDSLLDNYFVAQNPNFDFLLDTSNQVAHPAAGELGVPVFYLARYGLTVGDQITIATSAGDQVFQITTGIRDAQMGSSMASSTRFLVSDTDFARLYAANDAHESIISFLLFDAGKANDFQALYTAEGSGMPVNGQAITADLIRLVDTLGDGVMSGVLIMVSLLLVLIAMLNVRFTLLATLEEEVREIGTLKAIGLPDRQISGLYRTKYRFITAAACLLAALAAFPASNLFTSKIALNFGLAAPSWLSFVLPFAAVGLIYLIVMWLLRGMLGRISKLTIVQALTRGQLDAGRQPRRLPRLGAGLFARPELALAWQQFRATLRAWSLLGVVFALAATIIAIRLSLLSTLNSPDFMRYLGTTPADIGIAVQLREHPQAADAIDEQLAADPQVAEFGAYTTYQVEVAGERGWQGFLVETGDHQEGSIELSAGVLPATTDQIALSTLNAERLGLGVGDTLELRVAGELRNFAVVGVYQDITNGGMTAKTPTQVLGDQLISRSYYVNLVPGVSPDAFAAHYSSVLPEAKVIPMDTFRQQTVGSITDSLGLAVRAVFVLAALVATLIAMLLVRLQLHKQYADNAALRAIGFRVRTLRQLYTGKAGLAATAGVLAGVIISLTAGQGLVNGIFGLLGLGISSLSFVIAPLGFVALVGVLPIGLGLAAAWFATRPLHQTTVMTLGNA